MSECLDLFENSILPINSSHSETPFEKMK